VLVPEDDDSELGHERLVPNNYIGKVFSLMHSSIFAGRAVILWWARSFTRQPARA